MIYFVDIDGTICQTENGDYYNSTPIIERIDYFNSLYNKGHEIHYYTARGSQSGKDWESFTQQQLTEWGVKFTTCKTGKPHYDLWIDDKAINCDSFFENLNKNGD